MNYPFTFLFRISETSQIGPFIAKWLNLFSFFFFCKRGSAGWGSSQISNEDSTGRTNSPLMNVQHGKRPQQELNHGSNSECSVWSNSVLYLGHTQDYNLSPHGRVSGSCVHCVAICDIYIPAPTCGAGVGSILFPSCCKEVRVEDGCRLNLRLRGKRQKKYSHQRRIL